MQLGKSSQAKLQYTSSHCPPPSSKHFPLCILLRMRDSSTKRSISILTPAALFGSRTREIANRKLSFLLGNSQEHTKVAVLHLLLVIDAKRCLSIPQPFCSASYQRRGIVRPTIPSRSSSPTTSSAQSQNEKLKTMHTFPGDRM